MGLRSRHSDGSGGRVSGLSAIARVKGMSRDQRKAWSHWLTRHGLSAVPCEHNLMEARGQAGRQKAASLATAYVVTGTATGLLALYDNPCVVAVMRAAGTRKDRPTEFADRGVGADRSHHVGTRPRWNDLPGHDGEIAGVARIAAGAKARGKRATRHATELLATVGIGPKDAPQLWANVRHTCRIHWQENGDGAGFASLDECVQWGADNVDFPE